MLRHMPARSLRAAAATTCLALVGPAKAGTPATDSIRAEIVELRNDRGTVYCTLFAAPGDGFPGNAQKALRSVKSKIQAQKAVCEFAGLTPGVYAVAMIHDENDNRKVDTNWLGIPTEGIGASRDAKGTFGPPSFSDAAFRYAGGAARVPIRVKYL